MDGYDPSSENGDATSHCRQLIGAAQVSLAIQRHQLLLHRSAPWSSPTYEGVAMLMISSNL